MRVNIVARAGAGGGNFGGCGGGSGWPCLFRAHPLAQSNNPAFPPKLVGQPSETRLHQTLKVTPAMAAGVADRLWEMTDVVDMLEAFEARNHEWAISA